MQGLQSAQWEEALRAAADALGKVKGNEISFIAGKLADAETLIAAKVSFQHKRRAQCNIVRETQDWCPLTAMADSI